MSIQCITTTGGQGNTGKYINRNSKIVAAGLQSVINYEAAAEMKEYLLKSEIDALISDTIAPIPEPKHLLPLRKPIPQDMRHAGPVGHTAVLMNPPTKTRFQNIVDDLKETSYKSYWNSSLGRGRDPVPMLPEGLDVIGTTFGKPTSSHESLYDIIMPKKPLPHSPAPKEPGARVNRKYCRPYYNPDLTYGCRTFVDIRGHCARACSIEPKIIDGSGNTAVINSIQSNFRDSKQPKLGEVLAPIKNISKVPDGYSFGILKPPDNIMKCLTFCKINKKLDFWRKCLKHLNTVRRGLSERFLPTLFGKYKLNLKHYDTYKSGWLSKDIVYNFCGTKLIRFDINLLEPLLSIWQAFDGSKIKYDTFINVINYTIPIPEMPKIPDIEPSCLDYRTTYSEMVKPGQARDNRKTAGLQSGGYSQNDIPKHSEVNVIRLLRGRDINNCITPSIFMNFSVDRKEMYQKRNPETVRQVFEACGDIFSDKRFNAIWDEAQKLHSKGWVCYETFRRTLEQHLDPYEFEKVNKMTI